MKKREFMEIIRVAVRKELKEFLPTLVNECVHAISGEFSSTETDPVELTKRILKTEKTQPKQKKTKLRYTHNEVLNNILNETTGGIPSQDRRVSDGSVDSTQVDFNGEEVKVDENQSAFARKLGIDPKDLRRLLDPYHRSRLDGIEEALAVLGKALDIRSVRAA